MQLPNSILVVEDDRPIQEFMQMLLEDEGYEIKVASNGIEALELLDNYEPALIFLDIAMPLMDGWEAIRRLRADPMTSEIPIVALSAFAFGDAPDRAREAGADLCISKPCLPPQVARVVRAMLGSSRGLSH